MRELTKQQSILFLIGAVLMVVGAGLYVFGVQVVAPWVFAVGAFLFASIQLMQRYDGSNPTIKRLRRMMIMGDVLSCWPPYSWSRTPIIFFCRPS